jgi:hypothetical protein
MRIAEAKRLGELSGSQHALYLIGQVGQAELDRDALETLIVQKDRLSDVANRISYDKGIYGGGAAVERNRKAFIQGYIDGAVKEFKREYGRRI